MSADKHGAEPDHDDTTNRERRRLTMASGQIRAVYKRFEHLDSVNAEDPRPRLEFRGQRPRLQ